MIKSHTMRQLLLAAAAVGGLALVATPSTASPLAPGLIGANAAAPVTSRLVEKAHYRRHHRHVYYVYRHHRRHHYYAYYYPRYYRYSRYYCDDYYDDYYGGCGYPYGYGYPAYPFISFGFGFGGHHHHHHHNW